MIGEPIECLAAVAWQPNQPLSIEKVIVAPPKQGEVRIKLLASGVCHTDQTTWSGQDSEGVFPVILGHEGIGIVESVGDQVSSLSVGDWVIPLYIPECRECKFCRSKKTNLCSLVRQYQARGVMPDNTTRFSIKNKSQSGQRKTIQNNESDSTATTTDADSTIPIFHYMGVSTFSQYTVCLEISLAKIKSRTPLAACLLGCGVTTGWGAATRSAAIEQGATVAVFGLGAVGLSVVQGAKHCRASRIIAIDTNSDKFPMARQLGATDTLNPNLDLPQGVSLKDHLIEMTDGGLDYTFECVGQTSLMRTALEACHKGWGVATILGVAGAGHEISTRPFQLITGRTWRGCAFGGIRGRSELAQLVRLYMDGALNIDDYVNKVYPLGDINLAMDQIGKCIRSIVLYDDERPFSITRQPAEASFCRLL